MNVADKDEVKLELSHPAPVLIIIMNLKFRKCETPLMEPVRAMVSPFPEGRDLG